MLTADKLSWLDSLTISLGRKQLANWTQLQNTHTHSQSTNTEYGIPVIGVGVGDFMEWKNMNLRKSCTCLSQSEMCAKRVYV